jgi:hypothetical protein
MSSSFDLRSTDAHDAEPDYIPPDTEYCLYPVAVSDLELLKRVSNTVTPPEGMFSKIAPRPPARPRTPEFTSWAYNRALRS